MPNVEAFPRNHPWVLANLPGKLVLAHIEGVDFLGAMLEHAIGKPTRRSTRIEDHFARRRDFKVLDRLLDFQATTADISRAILDHNFGILLDLLAGFEIPLQAFDANLPCKDEPLRHLAGIAQPPSMEELIESFFCHACPIASPVPCNGFVKKSQRTFFVMRSDYVNTLLLTMPANRLCAFLFCLPLTLAAADSESASHWIKTEKQWSELQTGKVILLDSTLSAEEDVKSHSATAAIIVDAVPDVVRNVVEDGNKAAGFQESLVSSEILERSGDTTLVKQVAKVGFHKVSYIVCQTAENPSFMSFKLVEGDLKQMDGFWRFLPISSDSGTKTLLVYRLSLEPNIPIPGFMIRKSIANNLPNTLVSVKEETLRRADGSS